MTDPKIVVRQAEGAALRPSRSYVVSANVDQAWRWIGWFSLVLTLAGLGDWIIAWTPMRLGTPEWEFGTIVASFAGLPLVTMGFAGLLGSAVARGIGWQLVVVGSLVLVWGLLIITALVVFLLDVPLAMRSVTGPAQLGILKAIAKTTLLGVLFSVAYLVIAVSALRQSRARQSK